METFKRICIQNYEHSDRNGATFGIERGKEYLTSKPHADGTVTVFTQYWERAPLEYFAGEVQFTGAANE